MNACHIAISQSSFPRNIRVNKTDSSVAWYVAKNMEI